MATTIEAIGEMLAEEDVEYRTRDENTIVLLFETEQYENQAGDQVLWMVIGLDEGGEYFKMFAPNAFRAEGEYKDVFLRACLMVQWRTKLIQFEYDETDGEIRPIIEFPIEDGDLTQKQLNRCIVGMVRLIDEYAPVLELALEEGRISFEPEGDEEMVEFLSFLFEELPEDVVAEALRKADQRRRSE